MIALVAMGSLLLQNTSRQMEASRWVSHTHDVIDRLKELVAFLSDAENGRRGYILSGQDRYIKHFESARENMLRIYSELRQLTSDNPRRAGDYAKLNPLIQKRLDILAESIQHRREHGLDAEAQKGFMEQGQVAMEPVRQLVREITEDEQAKLAAREAAERKNSEGATGLATLVSVASLAGLLIVYLVLSREIRQRQEAESALAAANAGLEARVRERTAELAGLVEAHKEAVCEVTRLNEGLEIRVQERTAALLATNQELDAFCYSVSHDLRAPLRHIDGFVDMLRQETNGHLGPTGERYLGVISNSARRMGNLIDDLLVFSRMGRAETRMGRVVTRKMVDEVIAEVTSTETGRVIEWHIGSLPEVMADRSMLQQVWVNLLANAVKYSRDRNPARIVVAGVARDDEWEFSVSDNGAGFDMKYADKLFGVFQRLHGIEEFEGTGIGLANVRRIVTRHGGRTWANGKVNEGATFYFTLPKAEKTKT
ncbi:MAG TPA: CHASE3 domain-containing protein [Verrucomicrobiae bacterium]|nr:CHASE3 domain-containing protein [Verrucomicrobiae bacterium]